MIFWFLLYYHTLKTNAILFSVYLIKKKKSGRGVKFQPLVQSTPRDAGKHNPSLNLRTARKHNFLHNRQYNTNERKNARNLPHTSHIFHATGKNTNITLYTKQNISHTTNKKNLNTAQNNKKIIILRAKKLSDLFFLVVCKILCQLQKCCEASLLLYAKIYVMCKRFHCMFFRVIIVYV